MRIVMLTGDAPASTYSVARELGIREVTAGVLPDQKAHEISRLRAEGRVVGMAGDGINDAPALARATVGVAMGTGTDIAIESAGVTLIKGDLACIARARHVSRLALSDIRQNLYFAIGYDALGIPIAAGALNPRLRRVDDSDARRCCNEPQLVGDRQCTQVEARGQLMARAETARIRDFFDRCDKSAAERPT